MKKIKKEKKMETQTQIKLSNEELEMIKIKRENEELAKKEAEAKKKLMNKKEIEKMEKDKVEFEKNRKAHYKATEKFFNDFESKYSGQYEFKIEEMKNIFKAQNYLGDGKSEILATVEFKYNYSTIVLKSNSKFFIRVAEHTTWGRGFHGLKTNHGFKMFINGIDWKQEERALSNVATVHEKISTYIRKTETKKNKEDLEKEGYEKAFNYLKKKYPEATIEKTKRHASGYKTGPRSYSSGYTVNLVKVIFKNDLIITFNHNYDGKKLSFYKDSMNISSFELDDVIEALKNLEKKKTD